MFGLQLFRRRRWLSTVTHQDTASKLVEVFVDGKSVKVPPQSAIIQACKAAGIDIPRFCYHERLAIAGNCRMCLVSVEKMPKLVASCAQPVADGMRINTNTDAVKRAREGVMEFLLANHPLDCPVCDQGGECDLQDQAMAFGTDRSRFELLWQDKRAVEDKYFGPLVKTSMNRCIHCTRCVRFANEVAGVPDLGTTGRGNDMQIGCYVEKTIKTELSGNLVDLCPVGALTSRPYAFEARPWELRKTDSIDVMDAMGSAIRVDSRGMLVYRVLPREAADINEEWLADKSRYACDALNLQRLTRPMLQSGGKFKELSWQEALSILADRFKASTKITATVGDFADAESMLLLREMLSNSKKQCSLMIDSDNPNTADYKHSSLHHLNRPIVDFEKADCVVMVGVDVKREAPLLGARIRKNYLYNDNLSIFNVGPRWTSTFEYEHVSDDFSGLQDIKLDAVKNPIILTSQRSVLYAAKELAHLYKRHPKLATISVLNRVASRSAAVKLGFGQPPLQNSNLHIMLNADNITTESSGVFTVYIGHHGERGARSADLILPAAAYTEKRASFQNTEGRLQRTEAAVPAPGQAKPDWHIIRALWEATGIDGYSRYDSEAAVDEAVLENLNVARIGHVPAVNQTNADIIAQLTQLPTPPDAFTLPITDYYLTDVISRLSPTMAACSRELRD